MQQITTSLRERARPVPDLENPPSYPLRFRSRQPAVQPDATVIHQRRVRFHHRIVPPATAAVRTRALPTTNTRSPTRALYMRNRSEEATWPTKNSLLMPCF